ncbi:TetR/AcrR family transcriptional regulator [Actinomadura viridis]|uniref:AcrR family transcriptional regulator n=1 Tax=Actinomadura viridis TaxID=58110 RepID=A0A931DFP2_9ACTN|nr:TetR/AcrR family transcriptional regulator [Actinomadura viridis]MBG6086010.1 AcrR family transcriptional regulator [Actinomadura viridis]
MPSTTRERILDAALELIQQRGFGGTTVTGIEERAGLSPGSGSFYRHFRSKEQVFGELFERELDRAEQHRRTFERGPVTGDSQDALARRLLQRLEYMTRIRPLITLLAREHGRFPELTGKIRDALLDQGIAEEAEHLRRDLPGIADDDPHALLAVMVSALTGYHLSSEFFGRPPADIDPARFAAALARLLAAPRSSD